jgi:Spy/CpxP family protein refolding chaperone
MKNMIVLLSLLAVSLAAAFSPQEPPQRQRGEAKLNLTDAQQEQFQKISFDVRKKQIELKAKAETARLELRRLMTSDNLDKSAIEKKLNEVSAAQTALKMNRINGWIEKNKALTPEQQKLWKKELRHNPRGANKKERTVHIERMRMQGRPMMQRQP